MAHIEAVGKLTDELITAITGLSSNVNSIWRLEPSLS